MNSKNTNNNQIPNHVGLIIDGNRRWAKENSLPTLEGHRRGYKTLIDLTDYFVQKGVKFVSAYVFSTENWNRSKTEVKYLMDLAYFVATKEVERLNKKNIKVVWLGQADKLPSKLISAIKDAETKTAKNDGGTLALCLNYGGHTEISDAVKKIVSEGISEDNITPETIEKHLYAPEIPAIDLLIRTSGEKRLSNFMLWRVAYSELAFIDKNWPDIKSSDLDVVIDDFSQRHRRFGT